VRKALLATERDHDEIADDRDLTAAMFRLFVGFPQLVFRPFALLTIGGVFQACAKLVFSVFSRLTSLPVPISVPVLRGCDAPWDNDDARDLNLNLGLDRRERYCGGEDESKGYNKG
jgi:hypothetical protein